MDAPRGERTTSVHGPVPKGRGSLTTPIEQTSTFALADAEDVDAVYEGRRDGDVYTRYTNPTLRSVEARIAALERAPAALVTASGMGAITTTVLALVGQGGRVVANDDLYGGTLKLFAELGRRFGVRVEHFPSHDTAALRRLLQTKADLVWLETPTNPTLRLVDLAEAARASREAGAPSAVDATFGSPIATRPHELGVDLVLHSATKYLGGHSDISAGAVAGDARLIERVHGMHKLVGAVLDPHAAFLLERGLKTLPLRYRAASASAQALAEHLSTHPAVRKVHYPGLASHPQHALAKRQMGGVYGGLLSFDLASFDEAKRFLDSLEVVRNAASLGGVESLCSLPLQQSHRGQPPEVLARSGIVPGTVRLALGVEDTADLVADVDQALAALGKR